MGDHRKLKTYKKKPKESKRPPPIGAEQLSQVDGHQNTSRVWDSSKQSPTSDTQSSPPLVPSRSEANSSSGGRQSNDTGTMGRRTTRGEKDTSKKTGPTKERWLLTRKTWKYMQQAGRRLIPDGTQNRVEDLPKIEEYFQQVCRTEQKFILWSRKSSYPGAIAASRKLKRRIRPSPRNRPQNKASSADEAEVDEFKENDRRAAVVIRLLHSYLNIAEQDKRQPQQDLRFQDQKFRYGQTSSTSQMPPSSPNSPTVLRQISQSSGTSTSAAAVAHNSQQQQQQQTRSQMSNSYNGESESSNLSNTELLESLRSYSKASHRPIIPLEHITADLLHNKNLLKKIYSDLKRQQLSLVLNRHTAASTNSLSHASSLTSLFSFRRDQSKSSPVNTFNVKLRNAVSGDTPTTSYGGSKEFLGDSHLQQPSDNFVRPKNQLVPFISVVKPAKTLTTQGMQTDFLQLHEIGNLRKEYEAHKKELDQLAQAPEEEADFAPKAHSRRKSSVDNEDISQSVSDTIKRYLRMARKKSVNDDAANRFKRVNYDRNLRNIRAKGEINPPGMDEGNSKATQTLDAWPLLHYNFIRGIDCEALLEEAHADWSSALQRRKQQQEEYLQQQQQLQMQKDASSKSSLPGSPSALQGAQNPGGTITSNAGGGSGGLFHSGTQFFSNLWHGYHHSAHDNSNNSTTSTTTTNVTSSCNTSTTTSNTTNSLYNNATANIPSSVLFNQHHNQTAAQQQSQSQHQQSQYQQKNIPPQQHNLSPLSAANSIGGGSNNQSPVSTMQKSKSSSNVGQFVSKKIWKSRSKSQSRIPATNKPQWAPQGNCIWMSPSGKRVVLTDARLRDLTEIERKILHRVAIEKINQLNIGVNVQPPEDVSGTSSSSKSQKRRPLLIKRKALTTSIFDTGKKDDTKVNGGGLVFGVSIEKCVDNDRLHKSGGGVIGTASGGSDRGSRNSIISLLSGGGHNKIGSCESLPSRSTIILGQYDDGGGGRGTSNTFISPATMKISRSQTDVRRGSQDDDDIVPNANDTSNMVNHHSGQQVPAVVLECIKHIEEHGLHTVGIFRVSTSKKRVRQLKEGFDRGEITSLDSEICPHDSATILKEYLRDLPEPLLCRNLYKAFVKTQKIRNRRLQLEALSHLIQLLPIAHRDTLFVLLRFLARIVRSSDDVTANDTIVTGNKMDSNNLATVIAPNILRTSDAGRNTAEQEIDEQIDVINVIRTMIDHYEELFRVPAEMMDEIYTNMMDTHPEQLDFLCDTRDITDRYDDDMDSGSSSTPLSSPPPIALLKQQTTPFADDGGPDGPNDRNFSSRLVYSRDDFLHENTIKGGDPNRNLTPQRRERTSRMKYIESEGEISRRRRRERNLADSDASGILSPTKTTFNSNSSNWVPFGNESRNNSDSGLQQGLSQSAQQQYQQQQQAQSRRLFPPYGDQGVVTASLKIPVQMQQPPLQQPQTLQRQRNTCDTINSGHLDLSDIPYIEDNGCGQDILTGSLHFGRGTHAATVTAGAMAFQIPIAIEGRTTSSSSTMSDQSRTTTIHQYTTDDNSGTTSAGSSRRSSDNAIATQSPQRSPTVPLLSQQRGSIQGITQRPEPPKRSSARKVPSNIPTNAGNSISDTNYGAGAANSPTTLKGQIGTLHAAQHSGPTAEPKFTPSISNIGGAVLRSKTADFERILKQNKKHKGSDSGVGEDFATSGGSGPPSSMSGLGISSTSLTTGSADSSSSSIVDDANKSERLAGRNRQQQSSSASGPIYKRQELISSAQRKSK